MEIIKRLNNLREEINFEAEGFYTGLADEQNKDSLITLFNNIIDDFISGAEQNYDKNNYRELIAKNITKFDIYNLDTEDREYVCHSFEKIMDAINLESSGGILNEWMYGFNF